MARRLAGVLHRETQNFPRLFLTTTACVGQTLTPAIEAFPAQRRSLAKL